MGKIYTIDLSEKGFEDLGKILDKIYKSLSSEELLEYIAEKSKKELEKICLQKLSTLNEENIDTSNYMNNNQIKIEDNVLYLYNDSKIDISSKNMEETTKANYPAQLSLAKIVEYGIGYTGSLSENKETKDWEYDVNNHGHKGWYYIDDNGTKVWTNGYEGRLIYYNLKKTIEEKVKEWVLEFIDKKL